MRSRILRVGNSRGVRLPKPLLEEAGLPDEVEIRAEPGRIINPLLVLGPDGRRPPEQWLRAKRITCSMHPPRPSSRQRTGLGEPSPVDCHVLPLDDFEYFRRFKV
jgi:antitoxin MazE